MSEARSPAEPGVSAPGSPIVSIFLLTCVFLIPVLAAVRPVHDWDIWWHLRTGQWIAEHQHITTIDPFSTHGADRPWLAYSWLFEVLIWRLYEWLGLTGVIVYRVLMAVAVVVAFQRIAVRCEPRPLVSTLLTAVAALAVIPLLNERPWLFTILFTTLTLEVVLDLRRGERRWTFWVLPVVYILWANIHIQFVYGFVILGLGSVAPLLDGKPAPYWRSLLVLSIICALATLINPYGVKLYGVVIEYATQATPFSVVQELMAPEFRAFRDWLVLALALLTAFTLGRHKEWSSFEVLLFVVAVILAFRARRDIWVVILAALVILPTLFAALPKESSPVLGRGQVLLAIGIALLLGLLAWRLRGLNEANLREEEAKQFPTKAAEFVAAQGYEGPLFNHFNWGGYLIWKLPGMRVSMDGRTNLHGEERIKRSLATWAGGKDWEKDPDLREAHLVFAEADTALASLLRRDQRYRIGYEDELAVVFVRR